MYGPEMRDDLLEDLQALPEEWEWQKFQNGTVVCESRANNGAILASVTAIAYNPQDPKLREIFTFTDSDLEPFRQIAKDVGYPSVEHALSNFLLSKSYRRANQCPALR